MQVTMASGRAAIRDMKALKSPLKAKTHCVSVKFMPVPDWLCAGMRLKYGIWRCDPYSLLEYGDVTPILSLVVGPWTLDSAMRFQPSYQNESGQLDFQLPAKSQRCAFHGEKCHGCILRVEQSVQ